MNEHKQWTAVEKIQNRIVIERLKKRCEEEPEGPTLTARPVAKYTKAKAEEDIARWGPESGIFHGRVPGFRRKLSAHDVAFIILGSHHGFTEADKRVLAAALALAGGDFAD